MAKLREVCLTPARSFAARLEVVALDVAADVTALEADALAAAGMAGEPDAALAEPKVGSAGDEMPDAAAVGVAGSEVGSGGAGEENSLATRLAGGAVAQTWRQTAV